MPSHQPTRLISARLLLMALLPLLMPPFPGGGSHNRVNLRMKATRIS